MTHTVPTRNEVNAKNQAIFDSLESKLGFVPNLYATYANSENGLENYLTFNAAKTSLSAKEKEVVNLAVSEVNQCLYCLSAHTVIAKMNGFTEDQILELRSGSASFNEKLNALAAVAKNITENRGKTDAALVDAFLAAGYNKGNLIDVISLVGDKTISNYIHSTFQFPIDFPVTQSLAIQKV